MELEYVQRIIREEGDAAVELLLEKNRAYGNSAISPKRFFSQADKTEQIRVRIDDKLNRLVNGLTEGEEEDVVLDLIGYLILLRVAQRVQAESEASTPPRRTQLPGFDLGGPIGPGQGGLFRSFTEGSYD